MIDRQRHAEAIVRLTKTVGLALAALTGASGFAPADETEIGPPVGNVQFVYSLSEPQPGQYQVYITGKQLDNDRSCYLFIAHILLIDGHEQRTGLLDSTASFRINSSDLPASVWLSDVRVVSWAKWQAENVGAEPSTYGNPCLDRLGVYLKWGLVGTSGE